jgi:hypothetical protein
MQIAVFEEKKMQIAEFATIDQVWSHNNKNTPVLSSYLEIIFSSIYTENLSINLSE